MVLVYGLSGFTKVAAPPISADGPPPTSFKGELGQLWFDNNTTPPTPYLFNGVSWRTVTVTLASLELASSIVANSTSTTLAPSVKAVFDFGQSLVLNAAKIAKTDVTGIVNLATDAQAVAGTPSNPGVSALSLQPSNLAAIFASPPAIGGTSPKSGAFTSLKVTPTAVTAGPSPRVCNNRHGQVIFSNVSIAPMGEQAFTILNSTITGPGTIIMYSWYGTSNGSAVSLKSVVNFAGQSTLTFTNGANAVTSIANITVNFWVIN